MIFFGIANRMVLPCDLSKCLMVMKLFIAFLVIGISQVRADGFAQSITLKQKNISLENVFKEIRKQSGYHFLYNTYIIKKANPVSVNIENATLEDALKICFRDQPLTYSIVQNTVIIKHQVKTDVNNNKVADLPLEENVVVKDITVTGKVVDISGKPLPGVSISVKNLKGGTTTDEAGNFSIKVSDKNTILVFSFVGYEAVERVVGENSILNISLSPADKGMNEVVVIGYGDQQKRDVTGSISSVSAEKIANMPVAGLDQALSGQLAGVQVQQTSGAPGGNINVRIRGSGSIGAGNEPLYVVDGYPGITDLNAIDPNDIESIDVLKDASAAAIYGSRGANGVVIVTTKRGKAGKTKFSVNAYSGLQQVINEVKVMNAQEYADHAVLARNNGYADVGGNIDLRRVKNSQRPGLHRIHPFFLENDSTAKTNLGKGTDWQDEIFRMAPVNNFQISATGGNEKVRYSITGGYFSQQGILIESGFKRFTSRINLDAELSNKLKVGINLAPSYTSRDVVNADDTWSRNGIILSALSISPILPVLDSNGIYVNQDNDITSGTGLNGMRNPVGIARLLEQSGSGFTSTGNIYLDYKIINGLSLRTSFGANVNNTLFREFSPSTLARPGALAPSIPVASSSTGFRLDWVNTNTATYTGTFGEKHHLTALLGNEVQKTSSRNTSLDGTNFPTDAAPYLSAAGIITSGSDGISEFSLISYFGRITYNFDRKYLVTVNVRSDGSSRFGPNNKWGTFPSASVGWQVSDEPFMERIPVIRDLKLRASYGLGGNNNIGNYAFRSLLGNNDNYSFGTGLGTQVTGLAPNNLSNPDLKWERSQQLDLGIDLGLFANRIFLVVDYYDKETKDLLLNVNIPRLTGYTSVLQNIGAVRNYGLELSLNTKNFVNKFVWNTDFNISFNNNKVLALGPGGAPIRRGTSQITDSHIIEVGKPLGNFYGYIVEGVFNTQGEIDKSPQWATGNKARPGDYKFKDVNGDGVINSFDRTVIGNAFPEFTYGITNSFNYNNFDLSILLQGSQGNEVINGTRRFLTTTGVGTNQLSVVKDGWKSPEQPGNGLARPWSGTGSNNNNANMNSKWMEDGSYLSIRNISFGYQLPKKLLSKLSLQSLRLYTTVQNAYMFTKYLGYNPDVSFDGRSILNPGVDYGTYPLARTVSLGLNVGF